ncbi:MAG: hypothetical protein QM761_12825 [Pseudoxanthomonas sp.]
MKALRIARTVAVVALAWALSACGGGISGTYEDELGMTRLDFRGGGTVVQSVEMAGVEKEMKYAVDGDRIRIQLADADGATLVLTRLDENTLSGPMGIKYRRKK